MPVASTSSERRRLPLTSFAVRGGPLARLAGIRPSQEQLAEPEGSGQIPPTPSHGLQGLAPPCLAPFRPQSKAARPPLAAPLFSSRRWVLGDRDAGIWDGLRGSQPKVQSMSSNQWTRRRAEQGGARSRSKAGGSGASKAEQGQGGSPPGPFTLAEAARFQNVPSVQALRQRLQRGSLEGVELTRDGRKVQGVTWAALVEAFGAIAPAAGTVADPEQGGASKAEQPRARLANDAEQGGSKAPEVPAAPDLARVQQELDAATRKAAEALAKLEQQRERAAAAEGHGQQAVTAQRQAEQALEQARAKLVDARELQAKAEAQAARVGDLEARANRAEAQADTARQEAQGLTLTLMSAQKRILELESPTVEAGALGPVTERLESLDARTRWDPLAKMALGGLVVAVGGLSWMFSGAKSEVHAAKSEVQAAESETAQVRGTLEGTQAQLLEAQSTALAAERNARELADKANASQAERDQAQRELQEAQQALEAHRAAGVLRKLLGL